MYERKPFYRAGAHRVAASPQRSGRAAIDRHFAAAAPACV